MEPTPDAEHACDPFRLVGTALDQKFRVERLVAEGGYGVVYYAQHLALERAVALKVLKTPVELNRAARARFMEKFAQEARTIARISHPSIVQVLDFGASKMPSGEVAAWMVLEWLSGQTLEGELAARRGQGGRSPEEALALLRPVLLAVASAHEEGVAHRDIKPANMMLVQSKRARTLRLLDFGIAKVMEEGEEADAAPTRTRSALARYSTPYAAPEQVGQARTGPWTDVHALALVLCEVLTDHPAYDVSDGSDLLGHIVAPARPTPARRGVDVGAWEPVLARALAVKPDERYRNAGELLAALEANVPTAARASSATARVPSPAAPPRESLSGPIAATAVGAPVAPSLVPTQRPRSRRASWLIASACAAGLLSVGAVVIATRGSDGGPRTLAPAASARSRDAPTARNTAAPTSAPGVPTTTARDNTSPAPAAAAPPTPIEARAAPPTAPGEAAADPATREGPQTPPAPPPRSRRARDARRATSATPAASTRPAAGQRTFSID